MCLVVRTFDFSKVYSREELRHDSSKWKPFFHPDLHLCFLLDCLRLIDWLITRESHIFVFYTVAVHDTLTEYLTLSLGSTRSEGSRKSASDAGILLLSADLSEVRSLVKTSSSLLVQLVPWLRLGSSSSLAWFPFDDVALLRKRGGSRNCPIKEIVDIL